MIYVEVNGMNKALPPGTSLAQIVGELFENKSTAGCAVALNGEVISRSDWTETVLSNGDAVEVVHATQGG